MAQTISAAIQAQSLEVEALAQRVAAAGIDLETAEQIRDAAHTLRRAALRAEHQLEPPRSPDRHG